MSEEKKIIIISGENRFHKFRKEIGRISREEKVDIGVAAAKWAYNTKQESYTAEMKDFVDYTTHLQKMTTENDNRIEEYFK